jgi:hypothetical protein
MRFGAEDIVRNASLVMAAANEIAAIWPLRSLQTQTDLAAARQVRDDSRVASPIANANGSYIDQR